MEQNKLYIEILGREIAWLDKGTFESLQDASFFIKTLEMLQGLKIDCTEEIAWRLNFIDNKQFGYIANKYVMGQYENYLKNTKRESK